MRTCSLLFGVLLAASACRNTSTTPVSVIGRYNLQTVNGSPLPFTLPSGAVLASEVLTLNNDGTFTDVATRGDGTVVSAAGTYGVDFGRITFTDKTLGVTYTGQLTGTILTTLIGGLTERYQKQGLL